MPQPIKLSTTLLRGIGTLVVLRLPVFASVLLAQDAYHERLRPQFHFTPPKNYCLRNACRS